MFFVILQPKGGKDCGQTSPICIKNITYFFVAKNQLVTKFAVYFLLNVHTINFVEGLLSQEKYKKKY